MVYARKNHLQPSLSPKLGFQSVAKAFSSTFHQRYLRNLRFSQFHAVATEPGRDEFVGDQIGRGPPRAMTPEAFLGEQKTLGKM